MDLIIVESPTKSKTIQKFLGDKYQVLASYGHVRDLPKSELGVDVENNFQPKYVISQKIRPKIKELRQAAEKADNVILSTDPDREGEAIAWHILEALKLKGKKPYKRIAFHEITQEAIDEAMENPRDIDMHLVDSQQARRILDRLVGYKLSPLLWKKIVKGLSAGRVQSVALKIICEREEEIKNFKPDEFWSVSAFLNQKGASSPFEARLVKKNGKDIEKLEINDEKTANQIINDLEKARYSVIEIESKETRKVPAPPFTTSTLQQEASNKLRCPSKFTMRLAQQLYEKGYITYHRTDSVNIAEQAISAARNFISKNLGKEYLADAPRRYKNKSRLAQEAHEAIRPSHPDTTPESLKNEIDAKQMRLYEMIWRRFMATQAKEAVINAIRADISANNYVFRANGQTLKFEGFLKINPLKFSENPLPALSQGETLELNKLERQQHFTQPPPRYTEASLIKILEENGVGRPSTYSPIISLIQDRNYVLKNQTRQFEPTEIGALVNKLLVENFPEIIDIGFTAKMEEELDEIAEDQKPWVDVIREFYEPFSKHLEQKYKDIKKDSYSKAEPTDKTCPDCSAPIVIKRGRFGKFYACSKFPECKYTAPLESPKLDIKCPKCKEGDLVSKKTKRGKIFYACSRWPDCDFALWNKPINEFCPVCKNILTESNKGLIKCSSKECKYFKEKNEN